VRPSFVRTPLPLSAAPAPLLAAVCLFTIVLVACGGSPAAPPTTRPLATVVSVDEVKAMVDTGLAALRRGDLAGWRRALPSRPGAGRKALAALAAHLAPLPWDHLSANVEPIPSHPDRFDVRVLGGFGGAGPEDRIVAERVLRVRAVAGTPTIVGDLSPTGTRIIGVMAFHAPRALVAPPAVVLYDSTWRPQAEQVAAAAAWSRRRLDVIGLRPKQRVLITLYTSAQQAMGSFGEALTEPRLRFFTIDPLRWSVKRWSPADVGVVAPALAGRGAWAPSMLAHEMTHAFTIRWFWNTKFEPQFLEEGIAVYVEGSRTYAPLRARLATGSLSQQLRVSLAIADLWAGASTGRVRFEYLEAGALAGYIIDHWSVDRYRRFSQAIANSTTSNTAIDQITRRELGVSWAQFYAGWTQYVSTLP